MSLRTISIDGVNTEGIYIDTSLMFNKPAKDIETISIPGRDGELVVDYGTFRNFILTVPCFIHGNFDTVFNRIVNEIGALRGYRRIKIGGDSTHFREGVPLIPQTPTVKRINQDGWFDLSFNCKPFRYLRSGDQITDIEAGASTVSNPTLFDALPLIIISGYGALQINTSTTVEIAQHPSGDIRIDSEKMYIDGNLPYPYEAADYVTITGDYPRLVSGDNQLVADSTLNASMYPLWREL